MSLLAPSPGRAGCLGTEPGGGPRAQMGLQFPDVASLQILLWCLTRSRGYFLSSKRSSSCISNFGPPWHAPAPWEELSGHSAPGKPPPLLALQDITTLLSPSPSPGHVFPIAPCSLPLGACRAMGTPKQSEPHAQGQTHIRFGVGWGGEKENHARRSMGVRGWVFGAGTHHGCSVQ